MKELREAPLHYRVAASLLFGGISLFLFGVVFALVRQADHAAADQVWGWVVVATLIAVTGATGAFFALVAWGAFSDPNSRLGAWVQKRNLVGAVQYFLFEGAMLLLLLFGFWLFGIK